MSMVSNISRTKLVLFISFIVYCSTASYAQDLILAEKLSLSERYEDANEMYKELIKTQPNNGDIYFYYGENILKSYLADRYSNTLSGVTSQAKTIFEAGLKADTINKINAIGLGMIVLQLTNDTSAADKYFNLAEQMLPKKQKKYLDVHYQLLIKLATAQLYAKDPRYKKAIAYLTKGKEFAPNNPNIPNALGDVYMQKNEVSNAIANYNRALFLNPTNPVYKVKIGNIYIGAKNPNAARPLFDEAKSIDSSYAPIYKSMGAMWYLAGQNNLSKINYKRFLELSGNNIPAKVSYANSLFRSKDYTETLNVVEEILTIDKSRNYLNRLAAYSSFDKKPADYEKALIYSELFFKNTTPNQIILRDYLYYGNTLLKLKKDTAQIDKGLQNLLKAYQMDTTDYELFSNIATFAYQYNRFAFASEVISKKIAMGKANSADYLNLGKVYYKTKQYGKADTTFTQLTKIDSTNIQAYMWLANTYASNEIDNKLPGIAKLKFEKLAEIGAMDSVKFKNELFQAYSYLGAYYLLTVKPTNNGKASTYFEKLTTLDPKNKQWLSKGFQGLAAVFQNKKDYPKAIEYCNKVLEIEPNNLGIKTMKESLKKAIAPPKN